MFHRKPEEHVIDSGHVHCPVRKRDVEFDLCAGCRWTQSIDLEAKPPVIRCRAESSPGWLVPPWP